jgi:SAM-dependent methyltransferase
LTAVPEDPIEFVLAADQARPEDGLCWTAELPAEVAAGDDLDNPLRSDLQLFEDGKPLGPGHADHNRIRLVGGGMYSHWGSQLYFSTSDNSSPALSGREYRIRAARNHDGAGRDPVERSASLIERLDSKLRRAAPGMSIDLLTPISGSLERRVEMLERKVEYLLDELYSAKSQLRHLMPSSTAADRLRKYQIGSFDFQWRHLPYHDAFLSNPAWRDKAADDICARLERPREWLRDKRVLDCGCGPGRHAWAFAVLGARVTAFDTSTSAVEAARRELRDFAGVRIEQRNILDPLPYGSNFDVVWCYGVVHCTGDTYRALSNIAACVRPGGVLYLMVYPEPERTNIDAYRYYHEVYVLRQLTRNLSFPEKAELLKELQGERWALSWFDAISSEVNDLYSMEELTQMLCWLGFGEVRRTMPQEHSLNVTAVRQTG